MYTIGQVAKFLGVTRDTLKFYEQKGLVNPKHDSENGYRKYNQMDIYDIATVNFYREIDVDIKSIQEIRNSKSVAELGSLLEDKEQQIVGEIAYQQLLLKKVRAVKQQYQAVETYLGTYTMKDMPPIEINGEINHFTDYEEYESLQERTRDWKQPVTFTSLKRVIRFDDTGMIDDKFIIARELDGVDDKQVTGEVIAYPKCLYTVLEDGRFATGGENLDRKVEKSIRSVGLEYGYEPLGIVYVSLLFATYEKGLERVFLEVYVPVK